MKLDYVARPAGTKPAGVYWRRRAVVFGVLILLVWFAAKACGGSGSGAATRAADASPVRTGASPAPAAQRTAPGTGHAPSAAAVGTPGGTNPSSNPASSSSSSSTSSMAPAAVTAMCDAATLSLRAQVDRLTFHRPFTAGITLQIGTRSPSPCGLDAGALSAQVLNGSQVLWSSDGCPGTGTSAAHAGTGSSGGAAPTAGPAATSSTTSSTVPAGSGAPDAAGAQNVIAVPSSSAADEHYTWHGDICSGQLAPGRYDIVGRLGLAEAFAGTVTVT